MIAGRGNSGTLTIWSLLSSRKQSSGELHPDCCTRKGFFWDLAATYAPGARWSDTLPEPVFFNGQVVKKATNLEAVLEKAR